MLGGSGQQAPGYGGRASPRQGRRWRDGGPSLRQQSRSGRRTAAPGPAVSVLSPLLHHAFSKHGCPSTDPAPQLGPSSLGHLHSNPPAFPSPVTFCKRAAPPTPLPPLWQQSCVEQKATGTDRPLILRQKCFSGTSGDAPQSSAGRVGARSQGCASTGSPGRRGSAHGTSPGKHLLPSQPRRQSCTLPPRDAFPRPQKPRLYTTGGPA